nr:MAG: hypothetical protein [Hubei toti-like virus 17]
MSGLAPSSSDTPASLPEAVGATGSGTSQAPVPATSRQAPGGASAAQGAKVPAVSPLTPHDEQSSTERTVGPMGKALAYVTQEATRLPALYGTGDDTRSLAEWWLAQRGGYAAIGDSSSVYAGYQAYLGLSVEVYNYTGVRSQIVDPIRQWGGWYWRAVEGVDVGGEVFAYPANLESAISRATTGDITPLSQLLRIKSWALEGTTLVMMSRMLATSLSANPGNSTAVILARLLGYLCALLVPADPGGNVPASMPANSTVVAEGQWFPYHPDPGDAMGRIPCIYTTLEVFVRWTLGEQNIPGWEALEMDRSIVVVPVDHEATLNPRAAAWMTVGMMEYPVRRLIRMGAPRDPLGPLRTRQNAGGWLGQWIPSQMLMRIDGRGGVSADATRVMFVRVSGSMGVGTPALMLPGIANGLTPFIGVGQPDERDFTMTLASLFLNPSAQVPYIYEAFLRTVSVIGAGGAYGVALRFWGQHGILWPRPWEVWGTGPPADKSTTGLAPAHTVDRGWLPREAYSAFTPERALSDANWFVNSAGMLPGVLYGGHNRQGALSSAAVHFTLPRYSSVFGIAAAAGVAILTPGQESLKGLSPIALVAGVMRGSLQYACLYDLLFAVRGVAREEIILNYRDAFPATKATRFRERWGYQGVSQPGGGSMAEIAYIGINQRALRCYWPTNGQVFHTPNADDVGAGMHIFGRIAAPVLRAIVPDLPVSRATFGTFSEVFGSLQLPNAERTGIEEGFLTVGAADDWDRAWKLSALFSGLDPFNNPEMGDRFQIFMRSCPDDTSPYTCAVVGPLARFAALAVGDFATASSRYSWLKRTWWLTIDRPPPAIDWNLAFGLGIRCTDRTLALSSRAFEFKRWDFGEGAVSAPDTNVVGDALGAMRNASANPF